MKYNSIMTMNGTTIDAIAAAIEVLTLLFFGRHLHFFCICILIFIVVSESGDKNHEAYNWGPQMSRFAKRSPRSKKFGKPWCRPTDLIFSVVFPSNLEFHKLCS